MGQKTTKGEVFTSPYFSYVVRYARTSKKAYSFAKDFTLPAYLTRTGGEAFRSLSMQGEGC